MVFLAGRSRFGCCEVSVGCSQWPGRSSAVGRLIATTALEDTLCANQRGGWLTASALDSSRLLRQAALDLIGVRLKSCLWL